MSESKTDEIANRVCAWIVAGRFAPGDRLPKENDLAAQFGVSRPTVRNALKQVAGRGLTSSRRGSGHTVLRWWTTAAPDVLAGALQEIDLQGTGGRTLVLDLLAWRQEIWLLVMRLICVRREEAKLIEAARQIDGMRNPQTMVLDEINLLGLYAAAHPNLPLRMTVASLQRALQALFERLQVVPADPAEYHHELTRLHRAVEMTLTDDAAQLIRAHFGTLDTHLKRQLLG